MREQYVKPTVIGDASKDGVIPAVVAMAAGYAAGRAITKAASASPSIQLPSINKRVDS